MAGSAASEAVLFIGALVATTAFVGVFAGVMQGFGTSLEGRGDNAAAGLQSDVTIINDPLLVPVAPWVVLVKNTGGATLDPGLIDVLLDGQASGNITVDVLGSSNDDRLHPGETVSLTINDLTPGVGDHRVTVVTEYGTRDVQEFIV